ncbi:MAG: radical SAM family heme chaperone HemW [Eubacteriales bacterium]
MEARERKGIGLYIHLPFCKTKCHYCDFASYANKGALMGPYLDALKTELRSYKLDNDHILINTIFVGGGTPTLFSGKDLVDLLSFIKASFTITDDAEITIECNPETVDKEKLRILLAGGYNRLSLGIQAWQDRHLRLLGRGHSSQDFLNATSWAKDLGYKNISGDLIFALPGQTLEDWLESLNNAVAAGIDHLSTYSLKIEEGTRLKLLKDKGIIEEMEDSKERDLYHRGIDLLDGLGFYQYEISNFSRPGYESRHNLNYWKNGQYIGVGSGAHSYYAGIRWANTASIEEYIKGVKSQAITVYREEISKEDEIFETLMLGFRLNAGIDKEDFKARFGFSIEDRFKKQLKSLKDKGLIKEDNKAFMPTKLGMDLQNMIALTFLDQ